MCICILQATTKGMVYIFKLVVMFIVFFLGIGGPGVTKDQVSVKMNGLFNMI